MWEQGRGVLGWRKKIILKSNVLQCCANMNWCGRDFNCSQSTVELPPALRHKEDTLASSKISTSQRRNGLHETGQKAAVHGERGVPGRQSVNTLPLNHGATYWSTQMKSVSFFPDHKLIKNPLCWHQTVWHKLKLIHNWVCIDFYPAFAGYIRAWLVSFCSRVYSKCKPRSGLTVHRASQSLAQIKHKKEKKKTGSEGQFLHLYTQEGWMKDAFRATATAWSCSPSDR